MRKREKVYLYCAACRDVVEQEIVFEDQYTRSEYECPRGHKNSPFDHYQRDLRGRASNYVKQGKAR